MNRRVIVLVLVLILLVLIGVIGGFGSDATDLLGESSGEAATYVDLQDGRVVEYDFDATENTTLVPNRAGSEYNGSVRGNVTRVSRSGGSAVSFDGLPGQVIVNNSSSLPTGDGATFSFWIKPDGAQNANVLGAYGSYWFYVSEGGVRFVVMQDGTRIAQIGAEIPWGEWTHVVGTYDPDGGAKLFVNGEVADANATANGTIEPTNRSFALNMGGWNEGFDGSIDEFSLWERPLSETEVGMLYQDREQGLVFSNALRIGTTLFVIFAIVGVTIREHVA